MPFRGDHDGIGPRVRKILRTPEEIERAHRHLQVRLVLQGLDEPVHHSVLLGAVHLYPAGTLKSLGYLFFAADQREIHHVSEIALLVLYASRNRSEERWRYLGGHSGFGGCLRLRLRGLA